MNFKKQTLRLNIIAMISFFVCSSSYAAGIQKWVDEQGRTHYGERPPQHQQAKDVSNSVSVVQQSKALSSPTAILYSTTTCGYCKKAKAFMNKNGIAYREYFIDKSEIANDKHKQAGGKGVPLLKVGDRVVHGFSESSYKRFFDL